MAVKYLLMEISWFIEFQFSRSLRISLPIFILPNRIFLLLLNGIKDKSSIPEIKIKIPNLM